MKKVMMAVLAISVAFVSCKETKKEVVEAKEKVEVNKMAVADNVNKEVSYLTWKGTKPTGAHNGTVALKSGSLIVEDGKLTGGTFVVDMNSIKNEDLEGEQAGKLVGHLTSADFFDVAKYPTSTFEITSVEEKDGKLDVTGNLTIKDVTKSITIPAMMMQEEGVTTFKSEMFNINRADFNVKYGSKSFFDNLKDKFIDDIVTMSFEVKTKA